LTTLYSIIIPAYNEADELPATLSSVRAAMSGTPRAGELIVVDNNSTDATAEVAMAHGADQVVFEAVNQIARARNAGAAVARGKYLVFIDADTRVEAPLLRETLTKLEAGKHVGGGSIVQFEGEISGVGRFGIGLWERISRITQTAAGSYLFCLKSAFDAVGVFDQRLYAGEEVRLTNQLKRWAKPQGLRFEILTLYPVQTSARKLNWYSGPQILGWVFFMMFFPIAVRWKKLCGFWYKRPPSPSD
jgi:glycosyltransferase involved in cell wall biosynthesis